MRNVKRKRSFGPATTVSRSDCTEALETFKEKCSCILGDSLVSIVLYGSRAQNMGRGDSDLDVLVVTEEPIEPEAELKVSDAEYELSLTDGVTLSPLFVCKKDILEGVRIRDRLLLGIVLGYRTLYDRKGFFASQIQRLKENLKKENAVYNARERCWHIPSMRMAGR